jgi:hypothetical protein
VTSALTLLPFLSVTLHEAGTRNQVHDLHFVITLKFI